MKKKISQQEKTSNDQKHSNNLSREELWFQLENLVVLVAKEDQIVWTIFGVFWAANAVLLVALFTTGGTPSANFEAIISVAGTILSIIWFIIQRRAIRWLSYYETVIYRIEKEFLDIPPDIALSPRINNSTFIKEIGLGIRVRLLMMGSGLVATIILVN